MPECGVCNCVSSQPSHFSSDFANSWKAGWLRGWFHTWLHRWLQSSVINEKRLVWLKFIWLYHVLARGELPYISLGAYDVFSSDLGTRKNFFKRIKFPLYCFLFIVSFSFVFFIFCCHREAVWRKTVVWNDSSQNRTLCQLLLWAETWKPCTIFNANINTAGPENHLRLCVRQLTIGKKVRAYRVGEPLKHHGLGDTFETSPRKNERKKHTQSPT